MFRQYRQGDLPDVQIKPSEILEPLRALSQRDSILAKLIFAEISSAIIGDTEKETTDIIRKLLPEIKGSDSPFVNVLMRILHMSKDWEIVDPSIIGRIAKLSSNFHMGIVFLERQILHMQEAKKVKKLAKKSSSFSAASDTNFPINTTDNSDELATWHELASLYKSLGEEDVLLGLYDSISRESVTKEALAAELQGRKKFGQFSVNLTFFQGISRTH
jgi:DNA-dependent protein kinase catalytic subunit